MYATITYKPITPSLRFKCLINKSSLWSGKKINSLVNTIKTTSGRGRNGKTILYTRSKSYYRKIYRNINFNYSNFGISYKILRIEYDPNRSTFINLVYFKNNVLSYFLNISGTKTADVRYSYLGASSKVMSEKGTTSLLKYISNNTIISIVEGKPLCGAIYTRSAGAYSLLIEKYFNLGKALIKLKSGKLKFIWLNSKATIGMIGNYLFKQVVSGKAGRSRWFGIKPNVRGVAMNPVDHPHGGGQGKKSKKASPRTSWGKLLKWKKTSTSRFILKRKA